MYFLQNKSCPIIRADTIKPKGLPSQRQQYQSKHDHRKNGESAIAHASFKFIRHPYENSILIIIIFNGKISLPHHSERLHLSQTYSLFITACWAKGSVDPHANGKNKYSIFTSQIPQKNRHKMCRSNHRCSKIVASFYRSTFRIKT